MDYLQSLKQQENEFVEFVSNDLEKLKEKTKSIINILSTLGDNSQSVNERLQRIQQLENERIGLLLTEEKMKKVMQQQIEAKETILKKIGDCKDENKVTKTSVAEHNGIFEKYITELKLVLELEKVEGHFHTVQIHFVNYEKYPVKLVIDVESKTIVSASLDNLSDDSQKELLNFLQDQKGCTPFLIRLRECVIKQTN